MRPTDTRGDFFNPFQKEFLRRVLMTIFEKSAILHTMVEKELPKAYNPKEYEDATYKLWEGSGFFAPNAHPLSEDNSNRGKTFCMTMAPPNVTGSLHMGHALEYTQSDVLVRLRRMQGYETLWVPGTDHAGIATQNVVEKILKKEGVSRESLGREKFIEKVWEWKEIYGNTIVEQLKKLGASCDWSRLRFTMDARYVRAVEEAFARYYKKGWIYKGTRVISWCTRCQTSLSDLELEYKEEKGLLWYIRYPFPENVRVLTDKQALVVATTRPETMLGDEAVAVHPNDARYKDVVGKRVILPIQNREIPIIADESIDESFGTGAVKITPAHDTADFEIAQRHSLPLTQVIDTRGKMLPLAGDAFAGATITEARGRVVEALKAEGFVEKEEDYMHSVAVCYRCNTVVESIPSQQWFVKMKDLAGMAHNAVKERRVKFHPPRWEKPYTDWLENVKDWCISRQIWWGHKVPLEGETDVLDTWFSSALWPFAALGWPDKTKDLEKFYPTQALTNDRGIINLWDARMIFSGLEFMGREPFADLLIHATVLTKEGKRMSKSLGTGIDPMKLIETYGADATRFGLVWMSLGGQDMKFGEEPMVAGKKFLNKLWNAARFVMQKTGGSIAQEFPPAPQIVQNASIIESAHDAVKAAEDSVAAYEFGPALRAAHEFFWHTFCDRYIEWAKKQDDEETKQVLGATLIVSLKLFHPFTPFVTESLWQYVRKEDWASQLMVAEWPRVH